MMAIDGRRLGLLASLCAFGCGARVTPDEDDTGESSIGDPSGPEGEGPEGEGPEGSEADTGSNDGGFALIDRREVDVLFVVDNSGSMAEEQAKLATGAGALVDVLDSGGIGYRIGVTTTDNGNPWCAATSPEAGRLVATSCRARASEFVFQGNPPVDATQTACLDPCGLEQLPIVPTPTELDPNPAPRPWIEGRAGQPGNLDGVTATEALACLLPQGLVGCGFEQPLESMYKAALRSEQSEEPQYGFVRSDATLALVLVSDETDCSYSSDWQSIFLPVDQGGMPEVFWSDPDASSPTSAVCWNAGVTCIGSGMPYDTCGSENKDVAGNVGVGDDEAVLLPVSRYTAFVQSLEDAKQAATPGQEVVVAHIGGVPVGYETGVSELVYADATDPVQQADYGIGPGCVNNQTGGFAIPPVRERELVEAFVYSDARNMYSICADDFSPALAAIGSAIREQVPAPCFPACAADTNPVTPELDPMCSIEQEGVVDGAFVETPVPACEGGAVPDGADVCFEPLAGDLLSPSCAEAGWNLEFRFVRRPEAFPPEGESFHVQCELSAQQGVDCPNL